MSSPFPAVVVGSVDFGESDRVVRLLSAPFGRLSAMARGARASKRRWGAVLEPGTRVDVAVRRGRGELHWLERAEPTGIPRRAREELERIALLAYGCELCAALAPEGEEAPKLYGLLCAWLDQLEGDALPDRLALEGKALAFAGYRPVLLACARCGAELAGDVSFSFEAGGAVHAWCGAGPTVAAEALARAERLLHLPLARAGEAPGPGTAVLADFVQHQLGRALKSRALLDDLTGGPA